ncbi:MAG: MoxR family ATPase [Deltaproteobacteria bacterium]|nr:MoxR family ATPase [Deltaproteobacteria bacterium]
MFSSPDEVLEEFAQVKFIVNRSVATAVFIAIKLQRPLLVEGPAGVGKTELARVLAQTTGSDLIRMQCYEGLDESKALYEWNYQKQLLRIYTDKSQNKNWEEIKHTVYSQEFLLERPLLKALMAQQRTVLLIDEVDKSDEEFESFLLEILSDYQISIPELSTITAVHPPMVVLTSNNFRDFGDALKRRCIHLYLDYPSYEQELEILNLKVPGIQQRLAEKIVAYIQAIRQLKLKKAPSIAETLNWAQALLELGEEDIDNDVIKDTAGVFLKYRGDIEQVTAQDAETLLK